MSTNEIVKHESLIEALCHAMLEMTFVEKAGQNRKDNYSFRSIDDVMTGVRNPLLRHGVVPQVSFGAVHPVSDVDPYFWCLPMAITLHHVHSDQTMVSLCEGLGRSAGSGNVTNPDPRALGQAASYGIKMFLINQFMLAGGDDSADLAPRQEEPAQSLRPERQQPERADPDTEALRIRLLDLIGQLEPEWQDWLKGECKERNLSVTRGDMAALLQVEEVFGSIFTMELDEDLQPEPEPQKPEPKPKRQPKPEPEPEPESESEFEEEYGQGIEDPDYEEGGEADYEDESDRDGTEKFDPEPEPQGVTKLRGLNNVEPSSDLALTDQQFAYVLASNGVTDRPEGCREDRAAIRSGLRFLTGLKTGRMHRDGVFLVDADGTEVKDGGEAIANFRAG